ncbi:hypothetical protein E2C01_089261 [Portunus trituberculatus]|uniref:DUF7041 domain-containing protein n=1 Tax=Portunus trituberculatus TaxID=210409 RepID=A0A5B7JGR6_PORTR|nr:hypothetical protein [Portunus trituberculatus]
MDYLLPNTATWIYSAVFSAVHSDVRIQCFSLVTHTHSATPSDSCCYITLNYCGSCACQINVHHEFSRQWYSYGDWFSELLRPVSLVLPVGMQFQSIKITSSLTKFNHAVSHLPPDVRLQVSAVLFTAATSDKPYEELKITLLKSLQSSVATHLHELPFKEELGNEKPSQLLHRMKQLLGAEYHAFDAELFKQLFYQRLPSHHSTQPLQRQEQPGPRRHCYLGGRLHGNLTSFTSFCLLCLVWFVSQQPADPPHRARLSAYDRSCSPQAAAPGLPTFPSAKKTLKCTAPCTKASNSKGEQ